MGAFLLRINPEARLVNYSCSNCFRSIWQTVVQDVSSVTAPPCGCWHDRARQIGSGYLDLGAGVAGETESRDLIIRYDGVPAELARPEQLPAIHFEVLFSPATLHCLSGREEDSRRWLVVDPGHIASRQEDVLSRIIGLPYLRGPEDEAQTRSRTSGPGLYGEAEDYLRYLVTDPRSRHSIANILGPLVLRTCHRNRKRPATDVLDSETLLLAIMRRLEMLPEADAKSRSAVVPRHEWCIQDDDETSVPIERFVLIDDMAHTGWADFVRMALEIDSDDELVCFDTPDARDFGGNRDRYLLDLIRDGASPNLDRPLSFTGANEVLFLDLRLFASREESRERSFHADVLQIAQALPQDGLPWRGFSPLELEKAQRFVDGNAGRETEEYFAAITLLPRLISLVDPCLPIVLFSSTGQRRIVEILRGYENVICSFEKPRFSTRGPAAFVDDVRLRFQEAVRHAIRLARARHFYQGLRTSSNREESAPASEACFAVSSESESGPYIEVFIDESGDEASGISVGGLVAVHPTDSDANRLQHRLVTKGLIWGYGEGVEEPPAGEPLRKRADSDVIRRSLHRIDQMARSRGTRLVAFRLTAGPHDPMSQVWGTPLPDAMYRTLVRHALEVLLFDWPPASAINSRWAIYVGTRVNTITKQQAVELDRQWGMHCTELKQPDYADPSLTHLVYQMSPDDVHAILTAIGERRHHDLALRASGRNLFDFVTARATRLAYFGERFDQKKNMPISRSTRQLHFAADWVVSRPDCIPGSWWQAGFREQFNDCFTQTLEASRLSVRPRDLVAALTEWRKIRSASKPGSIHRWVERHIVERSSRISGCDFAELARRLDRMDVDARRLADSDDSLAVPLDVPPVSRDQALKPGRVYRARVVGVNGRWASVRVNGLEAVISCSEFVDNPSAGSVLQVECGPNDSADNHAHVVTIAKSVLKLKEGTRIRGRVSYLCNHGARILFDGVIGWLPARQITHRPIQFPSDELGRGDEVTVEIEAVDRSTGNVLLNRKKLLPDPWDSADQDFLAGTVHTGRVCHVDGDERYVLVQFERGICGILPAGNITQLQDRSPGEVFPVDTQIEVQVNCIAVDRRRLELSASAAGTTESIGRE